MFDALHLVEQFLEIGPQLVVAEVERHQRRQVAETVVRQERQPVVRQIQTDQVRHGRQRHAVHVFDLVVRHVQFGQRLANKRQTTRQRLQIIAGQP